MREISQGPKCTSQIWKSAVIGLRFFPLKSADVRGAGTRDEPRRTCAWEATPSPSRAALQLLCQNFVRAYDPADYYY